MTKIVVLVGENVQLTNKKVILVGGLVGVAAGLTLTAISWALAFPLALFFPSINIRRKRLNFLIFCFA